MLHCTSFSYVVKLLALELASIVPSSSFNLLLYTWNWFWFWFCTKFTPHRSKDLTEASKSNRYNFLGLKLCWKVRQKCICKFAFVVLFNTISASKVMTIEPTFELFAKRLKQLEGTIDERHSRRSSKGIRSCSAILAHKACNRTRVARNYEFLITTV